MLLVWSSTMKKHISNINKMAILFFHINVWHKIHQYYYYRFCIAVNYRKIDL